MECQLRDLWLEALNSFVAEGKSDSGRLLTAEGYNPVNLDSDNSLTGFYNHGKSHKSHKSQFRLREILTCIPLPFMILFIKRLSTYLGEYPLQSSTQAKLWRK